MTTATFDQPWARPHRPVVTRPKVDIIILALMASQNEAHELFSLLQARYNRRPFPIIVLLEPQMKVHAAPCLEPAAYQCLVKPVVVNRVLTRLTARLAEQAEPRRPAQEKGP